MPVRKQDNIYQNETRPLFNKSIRIAVDIDGVLTKETDGHDYASRSPNQQNIQRVNRLYQQGYEITLYTARYPEDMMVTKQWLTKHDVLYDNLILGKLQYDILIDDRATSCFEQAQHWIKTKGESIK